MNLFSRWMQDNIPATIVVVVPPTYPVLAVTTTAESIRDRAIAVVGALVPRSLAGGVGNRFRAYLNEGSGDLVKWASSNPAGAFRRFQVRTTADAASNVSNADFEERSVTLVVTIAYPHTSRTGPGDALDRDDIIDEDFKLIDFNLGVYGRVNFSPPDPDATPLGATDAIVRGDSVDFLVVEAVFTYQRLTS